MLFHLFLFYIYTIDFQVISGQIVGIKRQQEFIVLLENIVVADC